MKRIIFILFIVSLILLSGCAEKGEPRIPEDSEDEGIFEKITDTFASDTKKLEQEFLSFNDEEHTYFTEVDISKKRGIIEMEFVVADEVTSKILLNIFTLGISIKTYDVTQNFEELRIIYLSDKRKQVGIMTIPQKAIKDLADYAKEHPTESMLDSPYVDVYWEISNVLYDKSVPELIPTSVAEEAFGDFAGAGADEIAAALAKEVTHLEVDCDSPANWDADAEDDGIGINAKPLSADKTIVPIEGIFELKVYERVPKDEWSLEYKKGSLFHTGYFDLEGNERLDYFDSWNGYNLRLAWEDIPPYPASSDDNGIMYLTLKDKEGNTFSAKIGEDFHFPLCQLREE